jgi:hypothetical protein
MHDFPVIPWITSAITVVLVMLGIYQLNELSISHPKAARVGVIILAGLMLLLFFRVIIATFFVTKS